MMRLIKKTICVFLVAALIMSLAAISAVSFKAVTKITYGDFVFAVTGDDTLQVYSYNGEEKEVDLPETAGNKKVTGIYSYCFENSNIEAVNIPDSYESIGAFAFSGCESLTFIKLPAMLKSIGTMAFHGCKSLQNVDFQYVIFTDTIPFAAFSGCEKLSEVTVPFCVKNLGNSVFSNCQNLERVTLSENITVIPEYAFYGCESLSDIVFPAGLTEIGNKALADNTSLESVEFPSSLTTIGEKAFENDTSLTEIFIPNSVTSIGANAFAPMSYQGTIEAVCYEDSYAEEYCNENSFNNLKIYKKIIGDVNLNGRVDILDVTQIQKYKIGEDTLSNPFAKELADVNKDGQITIRDATLIQMYLARIIENFD